MIALTFDTTYIGEILKNYQSAILRRVIRKFFAVFLDGVDPHLTT